MKETLSAVDFIFGVLWLAVLVGATFLMRPAMIQREGTRLSEHLVVWFSRYVTRPPPASHS